MNVDNKAIVEYLLAKNGYIDLIAHGRSMFPTILDGQRIRIRKSDSFAVGDIIGYWTEDEKSLIVHRVVYIYKNRVFTKGDNSPEIERVVKIDRVAGIYDDLSQS